MNDQLSRESADAPRGRYHGCAVAAAYMRRERPGQTLQATALVHEAYLRLADAGTPWKDRHHFIGVAARSMRQILVDRARARGAQKRWAGMDRVSLTEPLVRAHDEDSMLPALDEALTRLEHSIPNRRGSSSCATSSASASRRPRRR